MDPRSFLDIEATVANDGSEEVNEEDNARSDDNTDNDNAEERIIAGPSIALEDEAGPSRTQSGQTTKAGRKKKVSFKAQAKVK